MLDFEHHWRSPHFVVLPIFALDSRCRLAPPASQRGFWPSRVLPGRTAAASALFSFLRSSAFGTSCLVPGVGRRNCSSEPATASGRSAARPGGSCALCPGRGSSACGAKHWGPAARGRRGVRLGPAAALGSLFVWRGRAGTFCANCQGLAGVAARSVGSSRETGVRASEAAKLATVRQASERAASLQATTHHSLHQVL